MTTDILIVGGGLSGSLLAMQLLRLPGRRRLLIAEPRPELGRGEAYSAVELGHTLNGNAARMSVEPDDSDDLTHWLSQFIQAGGWPQSAGQQVPVAELFPPRGIFGLYVQQRLAEAQHLAAARGSTLEHLQAEVLDWQMDEQGGVATFATGQRISAKVAVLATGLFPAARTAQVNGNELNRVAIDPWDVAAMRHLDPQARVLIVGAGLTMVDALVSLDLAGHRGPIDVYSRHGLWPKERRQPPRWLDFLAANPDLRSPLQLLKALRAECRDAVAAGIDWQAPLDTVRVHIARLWSQATDFQRRQFVRHVRPWWESHHHRSPPHGAALLQRLLAAGRLHIHAAVLRDVEVTAQGRPRITLMPRGTALTRQVDGDVLINSSGIQYDWWRVAKALPQQLIARGYIQPGPLRLGIAADAGGAVLMADGQFSTQLFTLGPPLRGLWWESTAVTDVAAEAQRLASRLAGQNLVRKSDPKDST